jgi:transposase
LPNGLTTASAQYGPNIKTLAVYLACLHLLPLARVCQILSHLFGTTFSEASVLTACKQSALALTAVLKMIKTALQKSEVLHNDETGFRVNKKCWWLHVAATCWLTLYLAHPKRGKEAIDVMGILPNFQGTSVHDSLTCYLQYLCVHALCNAHYLRELTFIFERFEQLWAQEMKALLLEIKACVQQAREQGKTSLPESTKQDFERRYTKLVQTGMKANPPPQKTPGKKGPPKKSDALNLLIRLQQHQDMILRFMHDFSVPNAFNRAESDLRMMKLRAIRFRAVFVPRPGWLSFVTFAVIFPRGRCKAFIFSLPYAPLSSVPPSCLLAWQLSSYLFLPPSPSRYPISF